MGRHRSETPSPWVVRHTPLVAPGGRVLDLACGAGRHVRHLLGEGFHVVAADRDMSGLADLASHPRLEIVEADLEAGPSTGALLLPGRFDGIVVTNYLYRPLLTPLVQSLAEAGVLIYETFARGNERFGRPRNPDYLLVRGELLALAEGRLAVAAYENVELARPAPAMVQRLCARRAGF